MTEWTANTVNLERAPNSHESARGFSVHKNHLGEMEALPWCYRKLPIHEMKYKTHICEYENVKNRLIMFGPHGIVCGFNIQNPKSVTKAW